MKKLITILAVFAMTATSAQWNNWAAGDIDAYTHISHEGDNVKLSVFYHAGEFSLSFKGIDARGVEETIHNVHYSFDDGTIISKIIIIRDDNNFFTPYGGLELMEAMMKNNKLTLVIERKQLDNIVIQIPLKGSSKVFAGIKQTMITHRDQEAIAQKIIDKVNEN